MAFYSITTGTGTTPHRTMVKATSPTSQAIARALCISHSAINENAGGDAQSPFCPLLAPSCVKCARVNGECKDAKAICACPQCIPHVILSLPIKSIVVYKVGTKRAVSPVSMGHCILCVSSCAIHDIKMWLPCACRKSGSLRVVS